MPVVLDDDDALTWLGDSPLPPDELSRLCRGLPSAGLQHEELPAKPKITRPEKRPPETGSTEPMLF